MEEFAVDHWKRSPARRLSATAHENMRFDQRVVPPCCSPNPGPGLSSYSAFSTKSLSAPDSAPLAACELPHAGVAVGQREGLEFLGLGIEAQDRVRAPFLSSTGALSHS